MKKIIAVICSLAIMSGSLATLGVAGEAKEFDGDIITNPWQDMFTTAPATTTVAPTTEAVTTEPVTTKNETTDFNPADLTYTSLECQGTPGLNIEYCIQDSTIAGVTPWYGDTGATFQIAYADTKGEGANADIKVNGQAPAEGVITMTGVGIVKINPTLLEDNAYSIITLKLATSGEMTLVIKKGNPSGSLETTQKPTDPVTKPIESDTTTAVQQDTTIAPTTAAPTQPVTTKVPVPTTVDNGSSKETTVAPTQKCTTKKIVVKRTKVKYVSKKKTSIKVKISLKKIKGAKKYKVQISTSRKFKKILVKKTVKKAKFTLKSKKIKNKKKLYVRVKAVKVINKKVYTGKWSRVKKIKVKK